MSTRRRLTKEERRAVYEKMGGHCAYCGCKLRYSDMQVDHVVPLNGYSVQGPDELDNMLPACRSCNHYKASASLEGFRKLVVKADPVVLDGVSVVTTTTSFISSATVTLRDQAESKKNSDAPTVMTQAEWNVVEQAAIKAQADEAAGGAKSPYGKTETVTTTRSEAGAQVTATVTIYTYTNGADTTVYTRTVETAPAWELVMVEGDTETDYYELYTFGNNASGQLAQGNNKVVSAPYHYPTLVDMGTDDDGDALASVIMVNAAEDHMITIKKDGYMWSSGRNSYGQLGNVNTSNSNTMVMVGQQFVDARPSPINMVKGQTLNISELITNKDKPLTVTYQAGIKPAAARLVSAHRCRGVDRQHHQRVHPLCPQGRQR